MKLLNAVAFVAVQFAFASPASALEAQPGDACPVVGRYTFSGGPELSGVTHQMVCNASNVWSSILDNDAAGNAALAHAVSLTGDISPSQITANQNDYSPAGLSTASVLRLNSNASRNITSLAGGADGRIITVMNVGNFPIVLKNDDGATGTAANRFALTGDLTLAAKETAVLMYDSTASRWRQISKGSATGAGGDNLGNHTATQNIVLGSNWLSGDGGNEGVKVGTDGYVGVMMAGMPQALLQVGDLNGSGEHHSVSLGDAVDNDGSIYGTGYIGFNLTGGGTSYATGSNTANNGGAAIVGNLWGRLHFVTIPDTGGAAQSLTSADLSNNIRMTIMENGKVGIGTDAPDALLTVVSPDTGSDIFPANFAGSTTEGVTIAVNNGEAGHHQAQIMFQDQWYVGNSLAGDTTDDFYIFNKTTASSPFGISPGNSVNLNAAFALTGDISPAQITANQNDYNPAGLSTASVLRVNSNASRNITSLAGGADGRIITVMNVGSFPVVLKNDDGATGTAANRFALTGDLTLAAKETAILMYDSTASRWRQIAKGSATGAAAAAGGSDRQIQFNNAGALGGVPNFEFNTDGHLDYWENLTTTAGGSYAHARFHADVAPTAAQTSGRTTRGLQGAIWVSAGNTNQVRKVIGSDGFAQNLGTGAIESIMGVQGYTYNNGNAAITNMFGSYTGVESTTGTVTSMLGTDIDTLVSGGTVSNVYGLLVNNQITGGAVTNRYGIYVNPPTGSATNDWGIYQDGTQSNRFNGNIGIGKNPGAGLDVGTSVAFSGDISPAQITANQNDYNPAGLSTASVLRMSSDASRNVTSLAGGVDGRIVTVMNTGSFPIVLKNDDGATGTAANRFALTGDLTLAAKQSAMLMYDSTASRWRQIANGTATGSGDNLGNHTATQNIVLGSNYLSGDGGNEGIAVDASGKIGIGAAPATALLTVNGDAVVNTSLTAFGGTLSSNGSVGTPGYRFYFDPDTGLYSPSNDANVLGFVTGGAERARIDANGNVGIGTDSPKDDLQIYSNSTNGTALSVGVSGTGATQQSSLNLITKSNGSDKLGDASSAGWQIWANGSASTSLAAIGGPDTFGIGFADGAGWEPAAFQILSNGRVGIGTHAAGEVPNTTLDVAGSFALSGDISPAQITADQNDYDPTEYDRNTSVLRLTSDASHAITGIVDGVDGRVLTIINVGTNPIVLSNQNVSSAAANRFAFGINVVLAADQTAAVIYDATSQRWRAAGLPFDTGTCGDSTSGFFVLTSAGWNGDLVTAAGGGMSGLDAGNALCLSDLTTYDWQCKSVAQNRGLLNSTHVKAFLCDSTGCNNATASTVYYFAHSNDPSAGGNKFKTDASGIGPQEVSYWDNYYNMNSTKSTWSGRGSGAGINTWATTAVAATCTDWTSSSGAVTGRTGNTNNYDQKRWANVSTVCNTPAFKLVCFVNP